MIELESMSPDFEKLRVNVGRFRICLHHFRAPDVGDPHDHPFPFTTTILAGGYIEEVWTREDGVWSAMFVERWPGTSHRVEASTIHRIVALPEGECVTSVVWHDQEVERRRPCFYRFYDGRMESRAYDQAWPEVARQAVRR